MYIETHTSALAAPIIEPRVVSGIDALARMICYRRPARSKTERSFIKKWLLPLGCKQDAYGNVYIKIGDSNVMWSSHTDTVHKTPGLQKVICADGIIQLAATEHQSNCLGADCTAGVWLMREMILAGKPGLYIFHREEEVGGFGSRYIANERKDLLEGIEIAIALDRMGSSSVITHQFTRCCSDTFGHALASALGDRWYLDDGGIFTDTANYTEIIPECTNISVGYQKAHTSKETLDMDFLFDLKDRLLSLDTRSLPVARNPATDNDDSHDALWNKEDRDWLSDIRLGRSQMGLYDLVREYPDAVADYLEAYGINEQELSEYVGSYYGRYQGK